MDERKKITIAALMEKIRHGQKISMLALYDFPTAVLAQEAGVDSLLVGDSASMNVYGDSNTLSATMEMMLRHIKAVRKGAPNVFLIGDMPFGSYELNIQTAVQHARQFIVDGGVDAVKLEGGERILPVIQAMVQEKIPVVGHLGLLPQTAAQTGGFKAQGREAESALNIVREAVLLADNGICLLILECVPSAIAEAIVQRVKIPVIGIGSGGKCHGQVQIIHDILGLNFQLKPKFVRRFAELSEPIKNAITDYIQALSSEEYPLPEETYSMKPGEEDLFRKLLGKL
jgi:3-methyl-2-oxobutanoate hydroxymethyltransferase